MRVVCGTRRARNLPSSVLGSRADGRFHTTAIGVAPNSHILTRSDVRVKAPHRGAMLRLFGDKLRYLRQRQEMTQVELARQLSLTSYTHVTKLEAGQRAPSLDLLVRIAYVFGVTTDYLLRDAIPMEEITLADANSFQQDAALHALATKIRTLRLRQGLGQTDLARQLGLARRGYISNLETGRKAPSLDLVVRIADLFGVTADYLLQDDIPISGANG